MTLSFAACGGDEEAGDAVPAATDAGETAVADSRPSTSQVSLDEYIGAVCGGQSEVGAWEEGESLRELSEGLAFVVEGMGALEPPAEVAEWHDAQIAFAGAFKETIDDFLEDPGDRTEDEFLLSALFGLLPLFEPVEQAISGLAPDVRARMIEAGCIDAGEEDLPVGGVVITEFASISAGESHTCGVGADGSVGCWGDSTFGKTTPPVGEFSSISAGDSHTCGVRIDGTVVCWGWILTVKTLHPRASSPPSVPGTTIPVESGPTARGHLLGRQRRGAILSAWRTILLRRRRQGIHLWSKGGRPRRLLGRRGQRTQVLHNAS